MNAYLIRISNRFTNFKLFLFDKIILLKESNQIISFYFVSFPFLINIVSTIDKMKIIIFLE